MFYDKVQIEVCSGKGGNGSMSFRREKYIPRGGPDGGSGGNGGSMFLEASSRLNTLIAFRYEKKFEASSGQAGSANQRHGKQGDDLVLQVPVGTVVRVKRKDEWQVIADLAQAGVRVEVARGGKGGLGNAMLATSKYQAPHFAELGEPGETRQLQLELKLIADVGLVGHPNVGKSTLISVISNARPKIADYPFTTTVPNLGVVRQDDKDFVVADIPGLIEGAHQGKGLGHEFLRHVERTRLLVHMLDGSKADPAELLSDLKTINSELELFNEAIMTKPQIVVLNKTDLLSEEALARIKASKRLAAEIAKHSSYPLQCISAVVQKGVKELIYLVLGCLEGLPRESGEVVEKVFRPLEEDERYFRVEKKKGCYHVYGKRAERIVRTTATNNREALRWMRDRLEAMGVFSELEKIGAELGDTIVIGGLEFEWE